MPLFTQVRGLEILRTSPFGDSQKLNFRFTEFYEVRYRYFRKVAHFEPQIHSKFIAKCFHGNHKEQEADNGKTERRLI